MSKISKLLKAGLAATLLFSVAGQADAAYPTKDDLTGKSYTLKGKLTRTNTASTYDSRFEALNPEFIFTFQDVYGFGNPVIQNFIITSTNLNFEVNSSNGEITVQSPRGFILTGTPQVYLSNSTNAKGVEQMTWQISENGKITIPDFMVYDYNTDTPFAEYTEITVIGDGDDDDGDDNKDSYPTFSELLNMTFTYNGTVDIQGGYEADYSSVLPESFEIKFTELYGALKVVGFLNTTNQLNASYNEETGLLKIETNNIFINGSGIGFYNADQTWGGIGSLNSKFFWQVEKDGTLTIPEFKVIKYNGATETALIAIYTPNKDSGEEPEVPVTYPASVTGEYSFTADVEYNQNYSGVKGDIPSEFDFTIESTYMDGFVGYNGYVYYNYNKETGKIKITSNRLANTSWYLPNTYMGVELGLSNANGDWPGLKNTGGDIMDWQVNADGSITIPEFTVVDRNNGNPVIARFTNCKVTKKGGSDPNPGGGEGDDSENGPVNPTIGEYEVIGTYNLTIRPTDVTASTAKNTEVTKIQVIKEVEAEEVDGKIQYYIQELDGGKYFNGNIVPFSYQSGTKIGTCNQFYAGQFEGTPIWFSTWVASSITEPQGELPFEFDPTTGFSCINTASPAKLKNIGFGWFTSTSKDDFIAQDLYSGFYFVECEPVVNDEVIGSYDWTIQPINDFVPGSETQVKVEVRKANDQYYVAEVGDTEYFKGQTMPFTFNNNKATFEQKSVADKLFGTVFLHSFETQPSYQFDYDIENGFTFNDGNGESKGYGWFYSSNNTGLDPTGDVVAMFYLIDGGNEPKVEYPDESKFVGKYIFEANRELLVQSYDEQLATGFTFEITGANGNLGINDYFGANLGLSAEYDKETGAITLKGNTLRYGSIGAYKYVGIANLAGDWTGMGAINITFDQWSVNEDGTINIPDFAIVDYSTYNKANGTRATILAKYTNVKLKAVDAEEEAKKSSFEGTYRFVGTMTQTPIAGFHTEEGVQEHSYITFTINEFNQITSFNEYENILSEDRIGNFMYNRGEVTVDGDTSTFRIDMETTSYAMLVQPDSDDDGNAIEGSGCIRRFGSASTTWDQGKTAFTITRTPGDEEGQFNYAMTPVSIFERYSVTEGESTITYDDQFVRWEDITFLSESPIMIADGHNVSVNGDDSEITFKFNVAVDKFEHEMVDNYKLVVRELNTTEIASVAEDGIAGEYEAEVENGVATAVIPFTKDANYEVRLQLMAYDASNELYAKSNSRDLKFNAITTGIAGIDAENAGNVRYFNLQGVEIANPEEGSVVIKVEGNKATKVLVR